MPRVRRLAPLPVDPRFDIARLAVEPGDDARTDRREGVESLAAGELRLLALHLARGDVVEARQTEHAVPRPRARHAVRAAADDERELGFMIDAPDAGGQTDRTARPDHRGRRLEEQQRLGRQRHAGFGGVVLVVQPHTDDLRRHDGREHAQPSRVQPAGNCRARAAQRRSRKNVAADRMQSASAFDRVLHGALIADAVDAVHARHDSRSILSISPARIPACGWTSHSRCRRRRRLGRRRRRPRRPARRP